MVPDADHSAEGIIRFGVSHQAHLPVRLMERERQ